MYFMESYLTLPPNLARLLSINTPALVHTNLLFNSLFLQQTSTSGGHRSIRHLMGTLCSRAYPYPKIALIPVYTNLGSPTRQPFEKVFSKAMTHSLEPTTMEHGHNWHLPIQIALVDIY